MARMFAPSKILRPQKLFWWSARSTICPSAEALTVMTRGPGHQEVESDLSLGDLPAYADDPRAGVLKRQSQSPRPSQSPDTLDGRMDTGGLTESLPRWATLRRNPFRVVSAAILVAIILAGGAWWWSYAIRYESTDDAFI